MMFEKNTSRYEEQNIKGTPEPYVTSYTDVFLIYLEETNSSLILLTSKP